MPQAFYHGGWTSPSPTNYAREFWRTSEKISGNPRGVKIPAFLPYFNDQTAEINVMRVYYRRMMADPVVKAAVLGKIMAVIALDLQVHPVNKKNSQDREIAEFCHWCLTERLVGGLVELGWNILFGMLCDGISVVEPVWRVEDESNRWKGKWVVVDQKAKDVDNDLVIDVDEFLNIVGIRGLRYNAGDEYDPGDFIIARYLKMWENPGGMSDMRACYGRYWVLDTTWKLRAAGLERRSMPVLFGTYATTSQKPSLENALSLARWNNWVSAPEGCKIEALQLSGQSQNEFSTAIQELREEIFLGIQGATLQALTGGQGTERGNSKVHETTANLLRWHLSEVLINIFNNHENGLLKQLVRLNYGKDVDVPRATLDAVDDTDLVQSLSVDQGLHNLGIDLSKEFLREKYGRPAPQDKDDVLPGVPQQPPPGAAPGAAGGAPGGGAPDLAAMLGGGAPVEEQGGGDLDFSAPPGEEFDVGDQEGAPGEEELDFSTPPTGFSDQNLFTATAKRFGGKSRLKKFLEPAMARKFAVSCCKKWNQHGPTDVDLQSAGRRLDGSGWAIAQGGNGIWGAVPSRQMADHLKTVG